ncbi:MAG: helix-turn-helix transcriptional regulator [Neisseria sp.]|nr:helix-turn-helix transcriptional regulator [Neisseria sp.]
MKACERIRLMREQKSWTQEDMADKLDLSVNGYARIERGETRLNIPRLEQIAEIFDIDILELLHSDDSKMVYQINTEDNTNSNISLYASSADLALEVEKLKLQLQHAQEQIAAKEALLEAKNKELAAVQELLSVLKTGSR